MESITLNMWNDLDVSYCWVQYLQFLQALRNTTKILRQSSLFEEQNLNL